MTLSTLDRIKDHGPWTVDHEGTFRTLFSSSYSRSGLHYATASACLFLSRFAFALSLTHVLPLRIDRPGLAIPIIITRLRSAHGFPRSDRPDRSKPRPPCNSEEPREILVSFVHPSLNRSSLRLNGRCDSLHRVSRRAKSRSSLFQSLPAARRGRFLLMIWLP